jgi:hypothetical protein
MRIRNPECQDTSQIRRFQVSKGRKKDKTVTRTTSGFEYGHFDNVAGTLNRYRLNYSAPRKIQIQAWNASVYIERRCEPAGLAQFWYSG